MSFLPVIRHQSQQGFRRQLAVRERGAHLFRLRPRRDAARQTGKQGQRPVTKGEGDLAPQLLGFPLRRFHMHGGHYRHRPGAHDVRKMDRAFVRFETHRAVVRVDLPEGRRPAPVQAGEWVPAGRILIPVVPGRRAFVQQGFGHPEVNGFSRDGGGSAFRIDEHRRDGRRGPAATGKILVIVAGDEQGDRPRFFFFFFPAAGKRQEQDAQQQAEAEKRWGNTQELRLVPEAIHS